MNPEPKSERLYQALKRDIILLRLAPGSALRLPALSGEYDAGLTPLRDCLNRLAKDRLVQPEHNKGFRVANLSMEDLASLEQSRSVIEGGLFAASAKAGDDEWEGAIVGAFHNLQRVPLPSVLLDLDEVEAWTKRHAAFHSALTSAAENPWLDRFSAALGEQLQRYHQFILQGIRDLWKNQNDDAERAAIVFSRSMAIEPHKLLHDAALARKPAAAQKAFSAHSTMSLNSYREIVDLLARSSS